MTPGFNSVAKVAVEQNMINYQEECITDHVLNPVYNI